MNVLKRIAESLVLRLVIFLYLFIDCVEDSFDIFDKLDFFTVLVC